MSIPITSRAGKAVALGSSNRVNPGDLITAEFINNILDRLDALESQIGVPTNTLPTITFTPTLTFTHPTFTFPTMITPTFTSTLLPPTFIATLITPTVPMQTLVPTLPTSVLTLSAGAGLFSPESEVTTLPGIGNSEKSLLDGAGITNLQGLAKAKPE